MTRPRLPDPIHVHTAPETGLFDYGFIASCFGFVLRSARRHRVLFIACFVAVLAGAVGLAAVLPQSYQVQASLLAQRNLVMDAFSNPGLNRGWDAPAQAAREMVMRRENLIALCKETDFVARHLQTRAPIARAKAWLLEHLRSRPPTEEEVLQGFVEAIQKKLWVTVDNANGTITIGFVWSNPALALDFVKAAVQSFLDARYTAEITALNETISILQSHDQQVQKQAVELATSLQAKEKELRGRVGPIRNRVLPVLPATPAGDSAAAQQLATKLALKQRSLADIEDYRRRQLQELQTKLADQLNVYAPQHPAIIETRKSIQSLSQDSPQIEQLRAEAKDLEQQLRREVGADAVPAPLPTVATPDLPDTRMLDDPRLDYDRGQLNTLLRQHGNLLERIATAQVEVDTAEAAFKYRYSVISPPRMPLGPLRPLLLLLPIVGIFGGLAFAFLATSLVDIRSGRVVEVWQVERLAQLTVLAEVKR